MGLCCIHGAEFAEYDGDDNNPPLHSIMMLIINI